MNGHDPPGEERERDDWQHAAMEFAKHAYPDEAPSLIEGVVLGEDWARERLAAIGAEMKHRQAIERGRA